MVKVALCQSDTRGTPAENVAQMIQMAEQAVLGGNADVIVFPEDSYFDVDATDESLKASPEDLDGFFERKLVFLKLF